MTPLNIYRSASEAFVGNLRELVSEGSIVESIMDPRSIGSHFGDSERPVRELISHSFTIRSPRDRFVFNTGRKVNPIFAVANTMWMLGGSRDLHFIERYNARGRLFSDDSRTLHGAHGHRLLGDGLVDQYAAVRDRLAGDPQSRRGVAVVYHPPDAASESRDIPCVISHQFLVRNGELYCITSMRSQSAAMVLPYDLFAFTFLHECLAVDLKVQLGSYLHNSGSFHYYLDEQQNVDQSLSRTPPDSPMPTPPEMPSTPAPLTAVRAVLDYEARVRSALDDACPPPLPNTLQLPEYWRDLGSILLLGLLGERCSLMNAPLPTHPYWRAALNGV